MTSDWSDSQVSPYTPKVRTVTLPSLGLCTYDRRRDVWVGEHGSITNEVAHQMYPRVMYEEAEQRRAAEQATAEPRLFTPREVLDILDGES